MKKANSKNNGHSSNGNGNGNGFVATVEATNGNGNGTKKTEVKEQVNPVEIIEDSIRITPHFDQLSTLGIEMFRNMGDIGNAKLFIDDLMMQTGNDHTVIAGLLVLLQAIREKSEKDDCTDHPVDYIAALQDHLFKWTMEFERSSEAYVQAVKSGNFVVNELVDSESGETVNRPATKETKSAPRKEATNAVEPQTEPFYGKTNGDYIHKDNTPELINAVMHDIDLPIRFWNTIFDSLCDMNGEPLILDVDAGQIQDAIHRENCRGLQIKRQTAEPDNTESLANQISALLNNSQLPQPIYDGLFDSLVDTFNAHIDQDEINQQEKSPEHIAKILRGYTKQQAQAA